MPPFVTSNGSDEAESSSASSTPSKKKIREMKLRADKLADVQSPTLVHCLNCGAAIKLSHKSEYDASHWLRHRARCVKKTRVREVQRVKPTSLSTASSSNGSSPPPSVRALTPADGDEDARPRIVDSPPPPDTDIPAPPFPDWQSWDWSKLKSRFLSPV